MHRGDLTWDFMTNAVPLDEVILDLSILVVLKFINGTSIMFIRHF